MDINGFEGRKIQCEKLDLEDSVVKLYFYFIFMGNVNFLRGC